MQLRKSRARHLLRAEADPRSERTRPARWRGREPGGPSPIPVCEPCLRGIARATHTRLCKTVVSRSSYLHCAGACGWLELRGGRGRRSQALRACCALAAGTRVGKRLGGGCYTWRRDSAWPSRRDAGSRADCISRKSCEGVLPQTAPEGRVSPGTKIPSRPSSAPRPPPLAPGLGPSRAQPRVVPSSVSFANTTHGNV